MNIFFRVTCFPRLSERWLIFFPRWSSVCLFFGTIMLAGYFFHNHPLLSSRLKSQMSTPKGEGITRTSLCMGNNRLHFHAVSSIRLFKICCIMTKEADKISVSVVHKQHFGATLSSLMNNCFNFEILRLPRYQILASSTERIASI